MGENIKAVIIKTNVFILNQKNLPILSKPHKELI
jgi:hypothetical protein